MNQGVDAMIRSRYIPIKISIYQIRQKWQELQVLTYQTTKEVK